ncbi:MAG: hypothetical protein QOE45_2340 [Frankiaceae bacterium]|nr:hypothetical protein [Frankiaceae bacterium]
MKRAEVIAYRYAMHGLGGDLPSDALLALGVQDSNVGSAALALSARGLAPSRLVTVWSFRGAPHLHRSADLAALSPALWPLSEADALSRLGSLGTALKKAGRSGVTAIAETAAAVRDVVTGPTAKGDLSAAVTSRIDAAYSFWCRGCGATHVHDQLLRMAAFHGGVRNDGAAPVTFMPIPKWRGVPSSAKGTDRLVTAYLTLHGPATPGDAGGFLGTTAANVRPAWPDGLTEVSVDGRASWLPAGVTTGAPRPNGVRLLPPSDPYLQMRDRELLVPDAAHRKALWTILASPGAVVVGGEVAGTWRAKQAGKGRLAVSVTAFASLGPKVRAALDDEAARVAAVRGAASYEVRH